MAPSFSKKNYFIIPLILSALTYRFWGISDSGFWLDELVTQIYSSYQFLFQDWISSVADVTHPSGYHLIMFFWKNLFGENELGFRSFSAICDSFALYIFFLIGKKLNWRKSVLIGMSLIYATSPTFIYYAQEARPYSLMLLLGLTIFYLLRFFILESKHCSVVVRLAIPFMSVLLTQVHYFGIICVFLIFLTAFFHKLHPPNDIRRTFFKIMVFSFSLSLVSLIPYVEPMIRQIREGQEWIPVFSPRVLGHFLFKFVLGVHSAPVLVIASWCGIAGLTVWKIWQRDQKSFAFLGVMLGLVGFCVIYEIFISAIFIERYLILSLPFFFLFVGNSIQYLAEWRSWSAMTMILLLLGTHLSGNYNLPKTHKGDLREGFEKIRTMEAQWGQTYPIYFCYPKVIYGSYYAKRVLLRDLEPVSLCKEDEISKARSYPFWVIFYLQKPANEFIGNGTTVRSELIYSGIETRVVRISEPCLSDHCFSK